ncbi:hypothetical protein KUCAC02_001627 [Chaenocephalus aceratus]|uniref:Uncharacterized protein n=1 Tax=Chaenocephalus aceratus TaxID=36190 RepID=A0ACB9XSK1_CHAAC|nr:hypothetical protein KUCAC02_001627 [Chaenocephalus aceratus]
MASNASHMLEAALEQMDDIIAGKMGEGLFTALMQTEDQDCPASECTSHLTLDPVVDHALKALQLTEALRGVLEGQGQGSEQEQHSLRNQVSTETAHIILKWLHRDEVNLHSTGNSESYQERLSRLEGDKESLILQVSVLTEQVEAQGVKISDLQNSLVEHQHKLNSTEEMLQQEFLHRTLADMEGKQGHGAERQHKAETVVNFISELQEQMCRFQEEINSKIQEKRLWRIPSESSSPVACPAESTGGEGSTPGRLVTESQKG